jgi:hypothetical protein
MNAKESLVRQGYTPFTPETTTNRNFQTRPDEHAPTGVEAYWDGGRTAAFLIPKTVCNATIMFDVMNGITHLTYTGYDHVAKYEYDDATVVTVTVD